MSKVLKLFVVTSLFYSLSPLANQTLTDAYVCNDCSFSQAKELARTKHTLPDCDFVDLNGGPATPDTPMVCTVTNETVVVLNPQDRLAWKFDVKAHFPQQYFMEVVVNNQNMSNTEQFNAGLFFDFYDDVVEATNGGLLYLNPATFSSTQTTRSVGAKAAPKFSALTSASNSASCHVAKEYYGNATSQDAVENFVEAEVARELGGRNPFDWKEDVDITGAGVQVSGGPTGLTGVGFNVSWDSEEQRIAAVIGSGDTQLVFDIEFKAIITVNSGKYAMNLYLDRSASKIDGRRLTSAMPNGVVNDANSTTTDDHPCLRDILEEAAEEAPWGDFVGDGLDGSNILSPMGGGPGGLSYCIRTVSAQTCSTTQEGRTCTKTVYSFPEPCF